MSTGTSRRPPVRIAVVGPTATGKTDLAVALAQALFDLRLDAAGAAEPAEAAAVEVEDEFHGIGRARLARDAAGADAVFGLAATAEPLVAMVLEGDNAIEVERLQADQIAAEKRASEDRQVQRVQLADAFESRVKGIVDRLGQAAREMTMVGADPRLPATATSPHSRKETTMPTRETTRAWTKEMPKPRTKLP